MRKNAALMFGLLGAAVLGSAVADLQAARSQSERGRPEGVRELWLLGPEPRQYGQTQMTVTIGAEAPTLLAEDGRTALRLPASDVELTVRYGMLVVRTIARREDTELQLPPARTVRVSVVDSRGTPVADPRVSATGQAGRFEWTAEGSDARTGTAVIAVPESTSLARVRAEADGFLSSVSDVSVASDDCQIVLRASATIVGRIDVGKAIKIRPSLRLWRVQESWEMVWSGQVDTKFAITKLPAGNYELEIVLPRSGRTRVSAIEVAEGQELDVGEIAIRQFGALGGTVLSSTRRPVRNARVRLVWTESRGMAAPTAFSDDRGSYRFASIVPGTYDIELYHPQLGWRAITDDQVTIYGGQQGVRQLAFGDGECSLRVELPGGQDGGAVSYRLDLPVSDPPSTIRVRLPMEERYIRSVPCYGVATVRRLEPGAKLFSAVLTIGETRLSLPPERPALEKLYLTAGGVPMNGVTLWLIARDSFEVIEKGRDRRTTDEQGMVTLPVPVADEHTVYLQHGPVFNVVERAALVRDGTLRLELPRHKIVGIVRDSSNNPVVNAAVGGSLRVLRGDGTSTLQPLSAVTVFKTRTNASGQFDVTGVAEGTWIVSASVGGLANNRSSTVEVVVSNWGEAVQKVEMSVGSR